MTGKDIASADSPDVADILQGAAEEAARLLEADGAMIYLLDPDGDVLRFAYESGIDDDRRRRWVRRLKLKVGHGMFGVAVAERRVVVTDDYQDDASFPHGKATDRFVREVDLRSMVVAPLVAGERVFGGLGTFSNRPNAFSPAHIALVRALADHAAAAMSNALLIEELAKSRADIARSADAERALREIANRISAIHEPGEVIQLTVDEAARLLNADGARIDLIDPTLGLLRWAYQSGDDRPSDDIWPDDPDETLDQGVSGKAVTQGKVYFTGDYLADARFDHGMGADQYIANVGVRSVMSAPLIGDAGPFGALTVYTTRPDAWDAGDAEILGDLGTEAAIALTNARLIAEIQTSRSEIARRADAERTLRQVASRISALTDLSEILQVVVDGAKELLIATGGMIDLNEDSGEKTFADAADPSGTVVMTALDDVQIRPDAGVSGLAMQTGQVQWSGDYLADSRFAHTHSRDEFIVANKLKSVIAAPLMVGSGAVGAVTVFDARPDAFGEGHALLLRTLADQAAVSISNARLILELRRTREEVERRAETERALSEMAARIAELHDPNELLRRIVDDSIRLLGSDGAHMTRMADDGTHLVPLVVSGGLDEVTETWLKTQRFPLMGGINGLAAGLARPIWTEDYHTDDRIPHERGDVSTARRLGLRGMAAVPLRAPEGTIIGTLAVSYREPHAFDDDELAVLKTLADHAAIAITNTSLLERLSESEERYRHLVQNSPDLVWSIDADARFTFVSDTCERLTGWRPEDLLGRHFGALVHESSRDVAEVDWTRGMNSANQELRGRLNLLHKDGHPIPAEFSAMGELDADGRFIGANGSVRDVTERDRLERELRESEERYRFLVQNSPDVVFQIDDQGRFTYLGETIERMTGFEPSELVGQHFSTVVDPASHAEAGARWAALVADPATPQTVQLNLGHKGGWTIPVEVSAIGMVDAHGRFDGIHGATRDVTERENLARNLREQAAALAAGEERAHLARELHDSVTQALFSMTLLTRTTEIQLDRDPAAARDNLGTLRDLQREALAEMRALIFELRPGNLEQDGLNRALKTHTAALSGRIGLPIVVTTDLTERLPIEIEDVLYRIAQEALHNVVKHAGARQARVELEGEPTGVVLRIVDDGRGFDPTDIPEGHLGLTGMRARAAKIDGRLSITSRPGGGTTIELSVPVPRPAAEPPMTDAGTAPTNGRRLAKARPARTDAVDHVEEASRLGGMT
jgi:PAS domain S-box-containing protein